MQQPLMQQINPAGQGPAQHLIGLITGRPMFGSVDVEVAQDQKIVTNGRTLLWMDGHIPMQTEMYNDLWAAAGRKCAGDACCLNIYNGPGKIGFGFELPGDLMSFTVVQGGGWVTSHRSFICGTSNLRIGGKFVGCCAMCFAGEGLFLTQITIDKEHDVYKGNYGMFYAGGFGAITRHDIGPGQVFMVSHGHFFAAHESTKLNMGTIGNWMTCMCTENGIVMKFYGPCVVFTQNRDPTMFDKASNHKTNEKKGASALGGAIN